MVSFEFCKVNIKTPVLPLMQVFLQKIKSVEFFLLFLFTPLLNTTQLCFKNGYSISARRTKNLDKWVYIVLNPSCSKVVGWRQNNKFMMEIKEAWNKRIQYLSLKLLTIWYWYAGNDTSIAMFPGIWHKN